MKCRYCNDNATWINPYNNYYYCDKHADEKVKQLMLDCNDSLATTKKDWFIKIINEDPNLVNLVLNPADGDNMYAYNSGKQADF